MARRRIPRIFGYRGKPPETRTDDELNTSDKESLSGKFTSEEDNAFKTFLLYDVSYIVATGGTTTTYTEGGKNYKSHTFTSTGTFIVPIESFSILLY